MRALAAALVLGAALLSPTVAAPPSAAGVGPLPACRLDDILTSPRTYDDWSITLVDTILSVGKEYKPPDLVPTGNAGITGGGLVRAVAIDDLRAMADAAAADGTPLGNVSAYRSYKTQVALFSGYVESYGYKAAVKFSARPGHSEHQLGLAVDFSAAGSGVFLSGDSATGRWMARNSWKYGWILSYPKGKYRTTCYTYEPWHYRYLGRDVAAKVHASGLTIREYLWANYTTADVPTGSPGASASPPAASASPIPIATQTPSSSLPAGPSSASPTRPSSAGPTSPPTSPTGAWFGLDPPVVIAGSFLLLASIGLLAWLRYGRRCGRDRGRGS